MSLKRLLDSQPTTNNQNSRSSSSSHTEVGLRSPSDPAALVKRLSMSRECVPHTVPSSPPTAESPLMPRMCATCAPPADLRVEVSQHAARQWTPTQNASMSGSWLDTTQPMMIGGGASQGVAFTAPREHDYIFHRGQPQGVQGRVRQPSPPHRAGDVVVPSDGGPPAYDQASGSPSLANRPQSSGGYQRANFAYPSEQQVRSQRTLQNRNEDAGLKSRQAARTFVGTPNVPEFTTLAGRVAQVQSGSDQNSASRSSTNSHSFIQLPQNQTHGNTRIPQYPQQLSGVSPHHGMNSTFSDASFQLVGQGRSLSGYSPHNEGISVGHYQTVQGGNVRMATPNSVSFGDRTAYSLVEPENMSGSSHGPQLMLQDTLAQSTSSNDTRTTLKPVPTSLGVHIKHRRGDSRGSSNAQPTQSRTHPTASRSQPPVLPPGFLAPTPHYAVAEPKQAELDGGQRGSSSSSSLLDFARCRAQAPGLASAVSQQNRQSTKGRTPLPAALPRLDGSHIESPLENSQRRVRPPRECLASPVSVPGTTSCSSTSSTSPYLANTEGTQSALSHHNSSLVGGSTEFHQNFRSGGGGNGFNANFHRGIDVDAISGTTTATGAGVAFAQDQLESSPRAHQDRSRHGGKAAAAAAAAIRRSNEVPPSQSTSPGDESAPSVRSSGNESSHNSYSNISNPQSNSLSPAVGRSSRNGKRSEPTVTGAIFDVVGGASSSPHTGTHPSSLRGNEQLEPLDVSSMQRDNSVNFCGIPTRMEEEEYQCEDSPGSNTRPSLVNTSLSFQLNVAASASSGSTVMSGIASMERHYPAQAPPIPFVHIPMPPQFPDDDGPIRRTTAYERQSNTVSCAPSTLSFEGDASALCFADSSSMTYSQSCERECSVRVLAAGFTGSQLPHAAHAFYSKGFDVAAHHAERDKLDVRCAKLLKQRPEVFSYPSRRGASKPNEIVTRCVLIPSEHVTRLTPGAQEPLSAHHAMVAQDDSADHQGAASVSLQPFSTLLPPQGFCCMLHFVEYQTWKKTEAGLTSTPCASTEEELLADFKVLPPSSCACADERSGNDVQDGSRSPSPSAHPTTLTCCDHVRRIAARKNDTSTDNGEIRLRFAKNIGKPTLVLDLDETLVHTTDIRPNYWDPRRNRNHLELFLDPDLNVCRNRFPGTPWSHETYLRDLRGAARHASSTPEGPTSCGVWEYLFQTASPPQSGSASASASKNSPNTDPFACTCPSCNPESVTHDAALSKFFSRRYLENEYRSVLLQMQKSAYAGRCSFDDVSVQSKNLAYLESDVFPECLESLYVELRPGVLEFLSAVPDVYEVVFFTAGMRAYAEPVLDYLDHSCKAMFRLYQSECNALFMWTAPQSEQAGAPSIAGHDTKQNRNDSAWDAMKSHPLTPPVIQFASFDPEDATPRTLGCADPPSRHVVKMLYRLNRPLDRVIIMDNSSVAYCMNRSNALPIEDFLGQEEDFMTATPPSSQSIVSQLTPIPPPLHAAAIPSPDIPRGGSFAPPSLPLSAPCGRQADNRQSSRAGPLPPRSQSTLPPPPHIARLRAHFTACERERQDQDGRRERPRSNVVRGEDDCELVDKLNFLKWLSTKPHPVVHLLYNQRQLLEEDTCF